jgi:hypothetical protein
MSDVDGGSLPDAGWYDDPGGEAGRLRHWDGAQWTEQFSDTGWRPDQEGPVRPLHALSRLAIAGLILISAIEAFTLIANITRIGLDQSFLNGEAITPADLNHADDLDSIAGVGLLIGYLGIAPLTFIPWFYRAYSNLPRLGVRSLRYKPGWAIGSWFIPIFNLFRPKQIANDIFRGSEPGAADRSGLWSRPVDSLLNWWWGLFILSGVLGRAASGTITNANDDAIRTAQAAVTAIRDEKTGLIISATGSVVAIAAAVLAIRVISRITEMQERVEGHGALGVESAEAF